MDKPLLLTVGNIYVDHNIFSVNGGEHFVLESGKDYFGTHGERVLGGSAVNAALQAATLGLEVGFVGKIGCDEGGQEVRSLLRAAGIHDELMIEDPQRTTSMAINLINKDGQFIGVHYGDASRHLAGSDMPLDDQLFGRAQAIYFGGTAKQPHVFEDCARLFKELGRRQTKVFYDPNRFPAHEELADRSLFASQLAHVEGYFPNEEELLQTTDKASVDEALAYAISTGVAFIALKRGAAGCRIKTRTDDFEVAGQVNRPSPRVFFYQ